LPVPEHQTIERSLNATVAP
jgi:hypothetical protein